MIINLSPEANINLGSPPYNTEGLTCAVIGNKGSGKSNLLAVMAEEFHAAEIPFAYYDPNGDAASLRELGGDVIVIGDTNHSEPLRRAHYNLNTAVEQSSEIISMVLDDGFSLVVDMTSREGMPHPLEVFIALTTQHYRQSSELREPCAVFVDEAQNIAPQSGATELQVISRRALNQINADGRKRGMVLVTATQRTTFVDKGILFGANLRVFGKLTWHDDYKKAKPYISASFREMNNLRSGDVFIVSEKRSGQTRIKLRKTTDLGKTPAFKKRSRRVRPDIRQLQLPIRV